LTGALFILCDLTEARFDCRCHKRILRWLQRPLARDRSGLAWTGRDGLGPDRLGALRSEPRATPAGKVPQQEKMGRTHPADAASVLALIVRDAVARGGALVVPAFAVPSGAS
jgi:hypothetical protein